MDPSEIAILKDKILKQLSGRTNKRESLTALYTNLNDNSFPVEVVGGYIYEMINDGALREGEKILFEGGYVRLLEKKTDEDNRNASDIQRKREKEDLEIKHLKRTKWMSIIAIIISIISLVVSFLKK